MERVVEPCVDRRRARGAASRKAIVDAAGRVVMASGLAAVTHRAIAEEAGVSLARTTYHFPTIEALLLAVQLDLTDRFDSRLLALISAARDRHASIVDVCCDFLEELLGTRRSELLATVELGVAAARRPELLSSGERSGDGVIPIIMSFGADEDGARTIFAAFYGYAILAAMRPNPTSAIEIRNFVTAIIPVPPSSEPHQPMNNAGPLARGAIQSDERFQCSRSTRSSATVTLTLSAGEEIAVTTTLC